MLKLKRIDLLTKNDKIHNKVIGLTDVVKKLECLCLEEGESWDGWLVTVWEGRVGMGKKNEK